LVDLLLFINACCNVLPCEEGGGYRPSGSAIDLAIRTSLWREEKAGNVILRNL